MPRVPSLIKRGHSAQQGRLCPHGLARARGASWGVGMGGVKEGFLKEGASHLTGRGWESGLSKDGGLDTKSRPA